MHGAAPRASTGGQTAEARRRATRRDGAGRTDGGRAELEDRSEELQREPYQRDQLNKKLTMAKKQLEQLDTELTVLKHAALYQRMPKVRGANRRHQRDREEAVTNHRRNKEGGKELRSRPSRVWWKTKSPRACGPSQPPAHLGCVGAAAPASLLRRTTD